MGKFDDIDDEELENERKSRIDKAKAAREANRDEVVILRGSHARRYLGHDDKEEESGNNDEGTEGKGTKSSSSDDKKAPAKKFSYFKS